MSKVSLGSVSNLSGNPGSAQTTINDNFTTVSEQLDLLVSRDSESPNTMLNSLDMNSKEILNLGSPTGLQSAARWADVVAGVNFTGIGAPSQTGNSGRFLGTDGSTATWRGKWPDRTAAEIAASVTPTNYDYEPGDVRRYGADPTGAASSTTAINSALSINAPVYFYAGSYKASGLSQTIAFQRILGSGEVQITKNANGVLFTSTGSNVEVNGIGFRGDASTPTYTGDNINSTGDHFRLINCGSRWTSGLAVKATGQHCEILGTCDIYQTTDVTGTGYDIQIGVSNTATLYHSISNIYTSQATGGIKFIDCGGHNISSSQFGKLYVNAGTSPAGVNGGSYTANRINGNVTLELSSAAFGANAFSNVTITFGAGTSGHTIDDSNVISSGATITDNSTNSNVVDIREGVPTAYTPTWTGASVNPAIGNGTIVGRYVKRGRIVDVAIRITMGSTTTYGTGGWFFSLPFIPTTAIVYTGGARVLDSGTNIRTGVTQSLTDGTARCIAEIDSDTAQIDSARPMTWANGDELKLFLSYST